MILNLTKIQIYTLLKIHNKMMMLYLNTYKPRESGGPLYLVAKLAAKQSGRFLNWADYFLDSIVMCPPWCKIFIGLCNRSSQDCVIPLERVEMPDSVLMSASYDLLYSSAHRERVDGLKSN
ncbi:hypothetical protein AB205_0125640 [Aquarana catesbeiana]|uniref:Uncharacterized protein n=1 Tax=Aquarana catesbeiana TaxID=8400 RepID=A0A2G9SEY9_AQUCT|nr:hypothetical protein AB205_0125640 [Aquarana catesbeiana]